MIKTKTWILIFAFLLLTAAGLALFLHLKSPSGAVAEIVKDGAVVKRVDLSLVTEPYEFTLSDERGSNVIRVEPGRIAVISADCPDGICVQAGWRPGGASPIICLPHRLVIRITGGAATSDPAPDAVSQ